MRGVLGRVLLEFPVTELDLEIPKWAENPAGYPCDQGGHDRGGGKAFKTFCSDERCAEGDGPGRRPGGEKLIADELNLASGRVTIRVVVDENAYFEVLSDISGLPVRDEYSLFKILKDSAEMQGEYERVKNALAEVRQKGYGIVLPDKTEISLDEPELIRHGSKYGVKIHARLRPSILSKRGSRRRSPRSSETAAR